MRTVHQHNDKRRVAAMLCVCLSVACGLWQTVSAEDKPANVTVGIGASDDSILTITTVPQGATAPQVIKLDSLGNRIAIPAVPTPPVPPLADTERETPVFIKTTLEDGELRSWDSSGEVWEYDYIDGEYVLRWERDTAPGRRIRRRYVSGDDTVVVSRDRSEFWAEEQLSVPRYTDDPVYVSESQYVRGSIEGVERVVVAGLVMGDIRTFGEVVILETGVVDGDVRASSIDIETGGLITGREKQSRESLFPPQDFDREFRDLIDFEALPFLALIAFLLILVAFITLSVSPQALSRTSETISRYPQKSFWTGLAGVPAYLMASVIVLVTVVGAPLALLMLVAFPLALLVGLVAHTQYVGGLALSAYGAKSESGRDGAVKRTAIGAFILMALWFGALALIDSRSEFLEGWGIFLLVISITVSAVATITGFGAVALTRFGRREYVPHVASPYSQEPPPPTPPPIPGASSGEPAAPMPPILPTTPNLPAPPEPPNLPSEK